MIVVPPAMWGQPSTSGDVRLWAPFNSNSIADVSAYGQSATNTGATITGNEISVSGTATQQVQWGPHASLAVTDSAWTLECFITWTSSDNAQQPGGDLQYANTYRTYRMHVYGNAGKVAFDTSDAGLPNAGPSTGNVLSGVGKVHMAFVRPAGSGAKTIRCYVAGVQVFTFTETSTPPALTSGTVTAGKISSGQAAVIAIDDVRLTMLELYTGTSFTPPTSPL